MKANLPKVSVIMTVYNGERFLRQAIDSLLAQTFTDFELILINDGSTDGTGEILKHYRDPRIVLRENPENMGKIQGIQYSLNKGINFARGEYIARQDSDDISKPERLAFQFSYMEENPEVAVVGSWAEIIDAEGDTLGDSRPPTEPELLKWQLIFQNCFTHSTVMFRRKAIERLGAYNESMQHAEDYELWWRISTTYPVANLPKTLVRRRVTPGGIVDTFPQLQREYTIRVIQRALEHRLGTQVSYQEALEMDNLMRNLPLTNTHSALKLANIMRRAYAAFIRIENLSGIEKKQISADAAEKLYILAGKVLRGSPGLALRLVCQAERLHFRLPGAKTISRVWTQV